MNTTIKTIIATITLGLSLTAAQANTHNSSNTLPCSGSGCASDSAKQDTSAQSNKAVKVWTCSMHPEIKASKPGKCPKCGMKLIPAKNQTKKKTTSTLFPHFKKQALACGSGGHGNGGGSHGNGSDSGNGHNHMI